MVRFQCIHCGGRIAVPDDHMGRLARCPECGGVTHPLAEHLSAPQDAEDPGAAKGRPNASTSPGKSSPSAPPGDENATFCDNCGEPLGKLQKQFEWDGHFVCGPCHRMLSLDKGAPITGVITATAIRSSDEVSMSGSAVATGQPILGDMPKPRAHPSELALAIRATCIGLCIMAVALYLIVSILQSLGYLVMWGAIAIVLLAVIYWLRRGLLAIRRRGQLTLAHKYTHSSNESASTAVSRDAR